jgi:uncharacterized protein YjbJ (UPF0337 family)
MAMSTTDKIKHVIEDVEGKAKEALGRVTGDHSTEAEGRGDQAKADLKSAASKAQDAASRARDAFKH